MAEKLSLFPSHWHPIGPLSDISGKMMDTQHLHRHSWQLGFWTHNHANQCFLHKTFSTTQSQRPQLMPPDFSFNSSLTIRQLCVFFTFLHYDGYLDCAQQSPRICFPIYAFLLLSNAADKNAEAFSEGHKQCQLLRQRASFFPPSSSAPRKHTVEALCGASCLLRVPGTGTLILMHKSLIFHQYSCDFTEIPCPNPSMVRSIPHPLNVAYKKDHIKRKWSFLLQLLKNVLLLHVTATL